MSKLRSAIQLQDFLDEEFAWRQKELTSLRSAIAASTGSEQKMLLRAGVALLYAHWEGFIKASAQGYLEFVGSQRLHRNEVKSCFHALAVRKDLNALSETRKISVSIKIIEMLINDVSTNLRLSKDLISAQSNLNSELFNEILTALGFSAVNYSARYPLLDEALLKRRNQIAHGDFLTIDEKGYTSLATDIISMLRHFKTDIENAVVSQHHLASP